MGYAIVQMEKNINEYSTPEEVTTLKELKDKYTKARKDMLKGSGVNGIEI